MRTGARKGILAAFLGTLACLALPSKQARADELQPGACGIKADYNQFRDMVQRLIEERASSLLSGSFNGVTLHLLGVTVAPVLGGLTYDPDGRPRRLTGPLNNNPTSSDDDYLRLRVRIQARKGSTVITTFGLNVAVAFPTNPPAGIAPGGRPPMPLPRGRL